MMLFSKIAAHELAQKLVADAQNQNSGNTTEPSEPTNSIKPFFMRVLKLTWLRLLLPVFTGLLVAMYLLEFDIPFFSYVAYHHLAIGFVVLVIGPLLYGIIDQWGKKPKPATINEETTLDRWDQLEADRKK